MQYTLKMKWLTNIFDKLCAKPKLATNYNSGKKRVMKFITMLAYLLTMLMAFLLFMETLIKPLCEAILCRGLRLHYEGSINANW